MNGFFIGFALALFLWFLAFLLLKAFVRRRTSPDYILELLQEEVRQLEADIDEKTEQNLLLLEEKINALRGISSEAERRIAVLNRELEKQNKETLTMAVLNKKPLVERLEVKEEPQPLHVTHSREKLAIKPRPVTERIAELQKAGFSPELIAKRLKLNPGEVQFYFSLAGKSEDQESFFQD